MYFFKIIIFVCFFCHFYHLWWIKIFINRYETEYQKVTRIRWTLHHHGALFQLHVGQQKFNRIMRLQPFVRVKRRCLAVTKSTLTICFCLPLTDRPTNCSWLSSAVLYDSRSSFVCLESELLHAPVFRLGDLHRKTNAGRCIQFHGAIALVVPCNH